jgi:hypothetical protein
VVFLVFVFWWPAFIQSFVEYTRAGWD